MGLQKNGFYSIVGGQVALIYKVESLLFLTFSTIIIWTIEIIL